MCSVHRISDVRCAYCSALNAYSVLHINTARGELLYKFWCWTLCKFSVQVKQISWCTAQCLKSAANGRNENTKGSLMTANNWSRCNYLSRKQMKYTEQCFSFYAYEGKKRKKSILTHARHVSWSTISLVLISSSAPLFLRFPVSSTWSDQPFILYFVIV